MLCELECSACGSVFQVQAFEEHALDELRYCQNCLAVKRLVESVAPPPIAYHAYQWQWRHFLRHPFGSWGPYWIWRRYLKDNYGVEVEERTIKLFPLAHLVLSDTDVLP